MAISDRLLSRHSCNQHGWGVAGSNWSIGSHCWSRSISGNRSSDVVSSCSFRGNCLWRERSTVADSVTISEVSVLPLGMRSTVAKLSTTLGPRRTTKRPLQELRRGPEGGGGAASLAVASSQQTGLATASCEDN